MLTMNNQEYSAYCYSQLVPVFTNTHKGQPYLQGQVRRKVNILKFDKLNT